MNAQPSSAPSVSSMPYRSSLPIHGTPSVNASESPTINTCLGGHVWNVFSPDPLQISLCAPSAAYTNAVSLLAGTGATP